MQNLMMGSVRQATSKPNIPNSYFGNEPPASIKRTSISQKRFFKTVSGWFEVWMPWQKQVLLCGITNHCSPKQLKYLATALEPIFHRDFLASCSGQYPVTLMFRLKTGFPTTITRDSTGKHTKLAGNAYEKTLEDFAAKYIRSVLKTSIRLLEDEIAEIASSMSEREKNANGDIDQVNSDRKETIPKLLEDTQETIMKTNSDIFSETTSAYLSDTGTLPNLPLKLLPQRRQQLEHVQNMLNHPRTVLPPLMEVSSTSLVASNSGLDWVSLSQQSSRRSSVHARLRTHPPDSSENIERLSLSLLNKRSSADAVVDRLSSKKFSTFSWCMDHQAAGFTPPNSKCSSAQSDESSHKHKSAGSSRTVSTQDFFPTEKQHRLGPYYRTLRTGKVRGLTTLDVSTVPVQKSYKPSRLWYKDRAVYKQRLVRANRLTMKQHFNEQINTIWQWIAKIEDHERLDFLTDLLKICEQDLLNFFSKCLIKRLQECSNFNNMSDRLLLNIFSFLPVKELRSACLVCRRWNYIAFHDELWRQKVLELGIQEDILNLDDMVMDSMNDNSIDWKAAYKELLTVMETAKEIRSPQQKVIQVKDELRNYVEYRVQEFLARIRPKTQLEVEETFSSGSSSPEQTFQGTRRASGVVELPVTFMSTTQSQIDAMTGRGEDKAESQTPKDTRTEEGAIGFAERRMTRREQISKAADFALDVRPDPVQATDILSKDSSSARPAKVYPARVDSIKPIKRVRRLQGHMDAVCTLMFDRRRIITGSLDHTIRVWDIRSGRSITKMYGHVGGIRCLQFNDSYIISGSWDMSIRVWDIVKFTEVAVLTGHMGVVSCLQFNRDFLVTGSHDKTVRVWFMADFSCRGVLQHHKGAVTCLVFHADRLVVSGSTDRTVKVSDIHTGECIMTLDATEPISALHVRGNLILGATMAGQLFCWREDTGEVVAGLKLSTAPIYKIIFAPDTSFGPRFLIGLGDGSIQEWDLVSMTCLRALYGHKGAVRDVQSSSDRIVSCSDDGNVRIWDLMPPSLRAGDRAQEDTIATTTIHNRRDSL